MTRSTRWASGNGIPMRFYKSSSAARFVFPFTSIALIIVALSLLSPSCGSSIPATTASNYGTRSSIHDTRSQFSESDFPDHRFASAHRKDNTFNLDPDSSDLSYICSGAEVAALTDFYAGVQPVADLQRFPVPWTNASTLEATNSSCCRWTGVVCSRVGVTGVLLSGLLISGTLSPSLAGLPFLVALNVSSCGIRGSIPGVVFSELPYLLIVDISLNPALTGSIPVAIGQAHTLMTLDAQACGIEGTIPTEIGNMRSTMRIDFERNRLTGTIPSELGNIQTLRTLALLENSLTGSIPSELGRLTNLEILMLDYNQLSGSIPSELGTAPSAPSTSWTIEKKLSVITARSNRLSGTIPTELAALPILTMFDVANNALNGTIVDGPFPSLIVYGLSGNNLSGTIPEALGAIPKLQLLSVSSNTISGTIPAGLVRNGTQLRSLILNGNQLEGTLPTTIGYAGASLLVLDVGQNKGLNGTLPTELGRLQVLNRLLAYQNSFSGTIPTELVQCLFLSVLTLQENNLTGTIPVAGDVWFDSLGFLNLSSNALTGTIPNNIWNVMSIQVVDFSSNFFTGTLPKTLGFGLTLLIEILLHDNQLSGPIDEVQWPGSIAVLDLRENSFSGTIPTSIGLLTGLELLRLSSNQITGTIPTEIGNLVSMYEMSMVSNEITGTIPTELGRMKGLCFLRLSDNFLSGTIPSELFTGPSGTNLLVFDVSENQLTGSITSTIGSHSLNLISTRLEYNQLSGTIPSTIGLLQLLETFLVGSNDIEGPIPTEFGQCANLRELELGDNRLLGTIPNELGASGTLNVLNTFLVNGNRLNGTLPSSMFSGLPSLKFLYLYQNEFTGPIPSEIGMCRLLQFLDVGFNHFDGSIPDVFQNLTALEFVSIPRNNISGSLPPSLFRIPALYTLDLVGNDFSGTIPKTFDALPALRTLRLNLNRLEGSIPGEVTLARNLQHLFLAYNRLSGTLPVRQWIYNYGLFNLSTNPANSGTADEGYWSGSTAMSLSRLASILINASLNTVDVRGNQLSGDFTDLLCHFPSMQVLMLSGNKFQYSTEFITQCFATPGFTSRSLLVLDLSDILIPNFDPFVQYFCDSITPTIIELRNVTSLQSTSTSSSDSLHPGGYPGFPAHISSFDRCFRSENLYALDASNNFLTGTLPASIFNNAGFTFVFNLSGTVLQPVPESVVNGYVLTEDLEAYGTVECRKLKTEGVDIIGLDPAYYDYSSRICSCVPGFRGSPPNCYSDPLYTLKIVLPTVISIPVLLWLLLMFIRRSRRRYLNQLANKHLIHFQGVQTHSDSDRVEKLPLSSTDHGSSDAAFSATCNDDSYTDRHPPGGDRGQLGSPWNRAGMLVRRMWTAVVSHRPWNGATRNFARKRRHSPATAIDGTELLPSTMSGDGHVRVSEPTSVISRDGDTDIVIPFRDIKILRVLSSGSSSIVSLGMWNGHAVAVKQYHVQPSPAHVGWSETTITSTTSGNPGSSTSAVNMSEFQRESLIHRRLRHPSIVTLFGIVREPVVCTVTEFMPRGSLYHQLRNNRPALSGLGRAIALDVAFGMSYLHSRNIVHRDLKSLNVLLDENFRAKVCDFGTSREAVRDGLLVTQVIGTAAWMAPEVISGGAFTKACDVYSFGILLWELGTGEEPYSGDSNRSSLIVHRAADGERPEIPCEMDPFFGSLIRACWSSDPEARPSFVQIIESLEEASESNIILF